jgi:hypothetical protein
MKSIINKFIAPYFAIAASACSVIGLIFVFVSNKTATIVALVAFCLFLLMILLGIIFALRRFLSQNYSKEYKSISSFYIFQSDDGEKSVFETYRLIQCKRMFLSQIDYKYKWSGSSKPILESNSQIIEQQTYKDSPYELDHAIIRFRKPLAYNESTVLHIKTENDDFEPKAKPYISCNLKYPIDVMQFRIMLAYKPDGYKEKAVFERKKLDMEVDSEFEFLERVEFDSLYKQYNYVAVNPSPGYVYRLRWEK